MSLYDSIVTRADGAAELPHEIANQVITATTRRSTALALGKVISSDTRDNQVPVLSSLPSARWVSGDHGLKSVDKFSFDHKGITTEELAVIVPIPDAVVHDSRIAMWDQVAPLITEAFGYALDQAILFGVDKPASWTTPSVVGDAIANGPAGTGMIAPTADPAHDLLLAAEWVSKAGYQPSGAVVAPGWQYSAAAARTQELTANPVGSSTEYALNIAGLPITVDPLTWNDSLYTAIVGDWSKLIIGIRQDVTMTIFTEGVITDETGAVVLNLMQEDVSALRCVFRVGALLAKPAKRYGTEDGSPFCVVSAASASS